MPLLNKTFLTDLGINLDEAQYEALADHFETTLQERVINEIVEELTPEQAQELTHYQSSSDQELSVWLQANVENLSGIVSDEVDILLGEIAENSEQI